jgi:hypothetical protein
MKILLKNSFFESLKTISRHETWWYKTYETIRFKIPMFLKNIWFFRKNLWEFRGWDYSFNLSLLAKSLEKTSDVLRNGHEVQITRLKKVEKIQRVIKIINDMKESTYINRAETELGKLILHDWDFEETDSGSYQLIDKETPEEKEHNRKVFERAREIEKLEFEELWIILKGQNYDEFHETFKQLSEEEKMKHDHWENWFDGSGIKNWWD